MKKRENRARWGSGNALLCLDDFSEAQEELRANPVLIPSAIEEALRYRSPVQMTGRVALADNPLLLYAFHRDVSDMHPNDGE